MIASSRALAEALRDRQIIKETDVEMLLEREQNEQRPLADILLSEGLASQVQLVEGNAALAGLGFADLEVTGWDTRLAGLVPVDMIAQERALPVHMEPDGVMLIAIDDPANLAAVDLIGQTTGRSSRPVLVERSQLSTAIDGLGQVVVTGGNPVAADPITAADESFNQVAGTVPQITEQSPAPIDDRRLIDAALGSDEFVLKDMNLHVNDLLGRTVDLGASDLHLSVGKPPSVRVNGLLQPLTEFPVLDPTELRRMIYGILTQKQREQLEENLELDMSHPLPGRGRFRVNVFFQRHSIGAVMRTIPDEVIPLDMLGLPSAVRDFAEYPRGLVLVTGPTGSGKSTTLASLVDIINSTKPLHIMTIEDPIEFLHTHKMSTVNQREIGEDTKGFSNALRHVLRQDPDVILVGEMRDLETIQTALTAAETGHLVFATLHTQDAPQSIDRIIDVFPSHQQQQVRVQLATSIQAIMTQQLIRSADGSCRYVASEVMIATPAIRNLIREGKIFQIYSSMQAGGKFGMQTMDQSLADLVLSHKIPYEIAVERCSNENDLARLCDRM